MTQAPPTKVCKRCRAEVSGDYTTCPYDGWQLEELPPDPLVGKIFNGKYEIESILGKGGMSIVYKARDVFIGRIVAIKILHNHLVSDNTSIERFRQEGQAAGSLNHPNIITVHEFGLTPEGQAFLIMECFEGPTLAEVLEEVVRIPAERGLRIMKQICDGLEHAHKRGVVHRDLKPSNLCLVNSEEGIETVKIVDFGIAKLLPQAGGGQRQQLTQTGQIFGSPLFMSPEQCQGKALDGRSDLYSLGCLMYESLTGVPPFMGPTAFDTMTMHINETAKTLKRTAPDIIISPELETPIMRLLEKNPDKRYQTAHECKMDLPPLPEELAPGTGNWTPSWYKSIRHNPAARGFIIIFLTAVVPFVLMFTLWNGPDDDRGSGFNKMMWNLEMQFAIKAMQSGNYDYAKKLLNDAYLIADSKLELHKQIDTLNQEISLGASVPDDPHGEWRKYTKTAVEGLKELAQERGLDHYEIECKFYQDLASTWDDLEKRKAKDGEKSVAQEEQRIIGILESRAGHAEMIASELDALRLYLHEENLLRTALSVDKGVLKSHHWRIADLNMKLADCLKHMQRTIPIEGLLKQACDIYSDSSPGRDPEKSTDRLNAILQLGQYYRDQSKFDEAKKYLVEGVALAEHIYKQIFIDKDQLIEKTKRIKQESEVAQTSHNDKAQEKASLDLTDAQMQLDAINQKIKESRALLIEGYNAYGDYFRQLHNEPESKAFFKKGTDVYIEARREMSEESKVPLANPQ